MRYAPVVDQLADLGGARWEIHALARTLKAEGRDVIEMTIGEPDVATPPELIAVAHAAMTRGRTGYSVGRGEPGLLQALAERYSQRRGRPFGTDQFLCVPGTQTALFLAMLALVGPGDEVLLGDPAYATYDGAIAGAGAVPVPVPLDPARGFRLNAADLEARITPRSRVILLNSPHNPTGAVLTRDDIAAIGAVARAHDLWIVADEVYEDLVYPGVDFVSPLSFPDLAERVVGVSSISKSHAAPGFRSGWCVGPAAFCARVLPLSETMLFGNQPFIADMTEAALRAPSPVASGMVERFARRAKMLHGLLDGVAGLAVSRPDAGMFALIDVRATGVTGRDFALGLLHEEGVAVMPGESFGASIAGWLRLSLTQDDNLVRTAAARIAAHAARLSQG